MIRLLALLGLLFVTPAFGQADVVASCGSVTIKAGTPHNVTVDLTGATCRMGGGGGGPAGPTSVWSAADAAAGGLVLTDGGTTIQAAQAGYGTARGTTGHSSGKYYVEFKMTGGAITGGGDPAFGVADPLFNPVGYLSQSPTSTGAFSCVSNFTTGNPSASFAAAYTMSTCVALNDVIAISIDLTAGKYWVAKNNVWFGSSDPVAGVNPMMTFIAPALGVKFFPAITLRGPPNSGNESGAWTLQTNATSQKYAPPAGFDPWDVGGCPEATSYLARTTGGDEGGNFDKVTTLICGLVRDGVWSKLEVFYLLAQQNEADAKLNLISTKTTLPTTTATFTAYKGYSAFPAGGIQTGFPDPGATKFIAGSSSVSAWLYDAPDAGGFQLGSHYTTGGTTLTAHFADGNIYCYSINGGAPTQLTATGETGMYGCSHDASTETLYINGINKNSVASAAVPTLGWGIAIGARSLDDNHTLKTLSEISFGGFLDAAANLALFNRVKTYMTSVGWTGAATKPGPEPPSPETKPIKEPKK